jgi:hypothetical protein
MAKASEKVSTKRKNSPKSSPRSPKGVTKKKVKVVRAPAEGKTKSRTVEVGKGMLLHEMSKTDQARVLAFARGNKNIFVVKRFNKNEDGTAMSPDKTKGSKSKGPKEEKLNKYTFYMKQSFIQHPDIKDIKDIAANWSKLSDEEKAEWGELLIRWKKAKDAGKPLKEDIPKIVIEKSSTKKKSSKSKKASKEADDDDDEM